MGLRGSLKQLLPDPTPVLATFDAVHGHLADAIFFRKLLDGDFPVSVVQDLFDALNLVGVKLETNGAVCLYFFVRNFRGAVLLMVNHFF